MTSAIGAAGDEAEFGQVTRDASGTKKMDARLKEANHRYGTDPATDGKERSGYLDAAIETMGVYEDMFEKLS